LIEKGLFGGSRNNYDEPSSMLNDILISGCKTPDAVRRVALGKPLKATLKPEHFEHLQEEYDWIKNLLSNALAKRQRGVNVLIYGNPGTGKTGLANALCNEIGTALYSVADGSSEERNAHGRRSNLAAALCLLQGEQNAVLLMDEAEDVFGADTMFSLFGISASSNGKDAKSKLFFNRLLENNTVLKSVKGLDWNRLDRYCSTKFGKPCSQLTSKEASALIEDLKNAKSGGGGLSA
jgi:hypothetical protein